MNFRIPASRAVLPTRSLFGATSGRRWLSDAQLAAPVQSYISTSRDPFLNLSIEHHLLQKSNPESAILFLYVNRPSIIIGRNQNPWLEVNLALLNASQKSDRDPSATALGTVDLVRRRSGGGTVFHDEGNVNWTVISPSAHFTRDKHAEMVVRALRSCGVDRARVNERHDVVLDQGPQQSTHFDPDDTHATAYKLPEGEGGSRPLKVSGSAYKLTRARALHHGTCLLNSPNLNIIPHYLHSPAKPFITARGVESVSSPVGNILLENERFMEAVRDAFGKMYGAEAAGRSAEVGEETLDVAAIRKGYDELKSLDWTFLQTPQFSLDSAGNGEHNLPLDRSLEAPGVHLKVRNGAITESKFDVEDQPNLGDLLVGRKVHETSDWSEALPQLKTADSQAASRRERAISWLRQMLPSVHSHQG